MVFEVSPYFVFSDEPYSICKLASNITQRKSSVVRLVCAKAECNKDLITRWFLTVASTVENADIEYERLLTLFPKLRFKITENRTISVVYEVKSNVGKSRRGKESRQSLQEFPVIIGSLLWYLAENLPVSSEIDAELFQKYRKDESFSFSISCPLCEFEKYVPIGLFYVQRKLTCLPTLAAVDSRRIHVNIRSKLLTLFHENEKIDEVRDAEFFKELMPIREKIASWRDEFSNLAVYTAAKIFCKLLFNALVQIEQLFEDNFQENNKTRMKKSKEKAQHEHEEPEEHSEEKNEKKNYNLENAGQAHDGFYSGCGEEFQSPKVIPKKLKTITAENLKQVEKIFNALQHSINTGNITDAVSKSSKYKFSNPSCSSMYNNDLGSFDKSWLSVLKSDVETSKGFVKIPSRYVNPPVNSPIQLMSSVLYLVKLIKSEVRTHTHQALVTSCLPYICKLSTSDNKNAGTFLEFLPGIQFSSRKALEFSSRDLEKLLLEENSRILAENAGVEREMRAESEEERGSSRKIVLYTNDYSKIVLPRETVRLDILISRIVEKYGLAFPVDFYFSRKERVGVIGMFDCLPMCERFGFTPLTRHCLMQEYGEYWSKVLSAEFDGNIPIFGTTAHLLRFANHSATAKLTAGVFGIKHALGLPTACRVNSFCSQFQALAYPQSDLVKCVLHPFQLAVVCVASLSSDGVEDGIIVSKRARDLGFGMTISQVPPLALNITAISSDKLVLVLFNGATKDEKQRHEFRREKLEEPDFFAEIDVKRKPLRCKSVLCDVLGAANLMSFSLNLAAVHIGSAARIFFDNPYDMEEEAETLSFSLEKIFIFRKKTDIVINFIVNTIKLLDLGDKYSTADGQKATVVNIMPVEDMPFFSSRNPRIPPNPDVVVNISSSKRQTLGLNIGAAVNMLKLEYPDEIDMNLFCGDKSIRHMQLLKHLLNLCLDHEIIACEKIYDGTTGQVFTDEKTGEPIHGDVYLVPFLRYEQQGNKVASYTKGETIPRTLQGGFVVKSRGKKGGLKVGQADQFVFMSEGSIPSLLKQNQLMSEPPLNFDRFSGRITQSACAAMKTFDMLDYNVEIV